MSFFKSLRHYGRLGLKYANKLGGLGSKGAGFLKSNNGRVLLDAIDYFKPEWGVKRHAQTFNHFNKDYNSLLNKINNPYNSGNSYSKNPSIEKNRPKFKFPVDKINEYFRNNKKPEQDKPGNYMGSMREITDERHRNRGLPMNGSWGNL